MPDMTENARDSKQIHVFLLDDHEIVRRGVRDLLEAEPDIVVVGEAGTAASALARIPALRPDVAVHQLRHGHVAGHADQHVCVVLRQASGGHQELDRLAQLIEKARKAGRK